MEVLTYKCPNCGAPLAFNSESQKWDCKFCISTFDKKTLEDIRKKESEAEGVSSYEEVAKNAQKSGKTAQKNPDTSPSEAKCYSCPSCGAKLITDDTTAATFCVFCGNPSVIPEQLSEKFEPSAIIPFKMNKNDAVEALQTLCKKKPLLPHDFRNQNHIEEVRGVYVPFWLFDVSASSTLDAKANNVTMWSDSNYNYTKTDVYDVHRAGNFQIEGLPADGSAKMEDTMMDSLEPFSYEDITDFDMAYLSGFFAEKYDEDGDKVYHRVKDRIDEVAKRLLLESVEGYTSTQAENINTQVLNKKNKYVMLPVWLLHTKYHDQEYMFAMNGQSGKMVGNLPMSFGRLAAIFAGITAIVTIIGFIGGILFC